MGRRRGSEVAVPVLSGLLVEFSHDGLTLYISSRLMLSKLDEITIERHARLKCLVEVELCQHSATAV
jgi:hypothetical protein